MSFKIEKKLVSRGTYHRSDYQEFLAAVKSLKVGESFLMERLESNHRLAFSIAKTWLGVTIAHSKEGNKFRVGRTA